MTNESWAEQLRAAIAGIEDGVRTIQSLGAHPPSDGLVELGGLWHELVPSDDTDARSKLIKSTGESIAISGPEALRRALGQLDITLSDLLVTASAGEVHGLGFVRTSDFNGRLVIRKLNRVDGSKVAVVVGMRKALPDNHPLLTAFPKENCPGRPDAVIALGPAGWGVRSFYRLQTAMGASRWMKTEEVERDRVESQREERLRGEARRRQWEADRTARARELMSSAGEQ